MKFKFVLKLSLFAFAGFSAGNLAAETCEQTGHTDTPLSQFIIDVEKGTVIDRKTNLMWQRCINGTTDQVCNYPEGGLASLKVFWADTMVQGSESEFSGYTDWRMPNAIELMSIHDFSCYNAVGVQKNHGINFSVFPVADTGEEHLSLWTSTSYRKARSVVASYTSFNPSLNNEFSGLTLSYRTDEIASVHGLRLVRNVKRVEFEVADTKDEK